MGSKKWYDIPREPADPELAATYPMCLIRFPHGEGGPKGLSLTESRPRKHFRTKIEAKSSRNRAEIEDFGLMASLTYEYLGAQPFMWQA